MAYLIFNTEEEAKKFTNKEALNRGCDGVHTKYWWSWRKHPETDQTYLNVGDEFEGRETPQNSTLVEELTEDWNPPETNLT